MDYNPFDPNEQDEHSTEQDLNATVVVSDNQSTIDGLSQSAFSIDLPLVKKKIYCPRHPEEKCHHIRLDNYLPICKICVKICAKLLPKIPTK